MYHLLSEICTSIAIAFFVICVANLVDEYKVAQQRTGMGETVSVVGLIWGLHALIAKPLDSLGPIIGTYFLENAGWTGAAASASFRGFCASLVFFAMRPLLAWSSLATSEVSNGAAIGRAFAFAPVAFGSIFASACLTTLSFASATVDEEAAGSEPHFFSGLVPSAFVAQTLAAAAAVFAASPRFLKADALAAALAGVSAVLALAPGTGAFCCADFWPDIQEMDIQDDIDTRKELAAAATISCSQLINSNPKATPSPKRLQIPQTMLHTRPRSSQIPSTNASNVFPNAMKTCSYHAAGSC